jgi:hypothetical protein
MWPEQARLRTVSCADIMTSSAIRVEIIYTKPMTMTRKGLLTAIRPTGNGDASLVGRVRRRETPVIVLRFCDLP